MSMMLNVNGRQHEITAEAETPLLYALLAEELAQRVLDAAARSLHTTVDAARALPSEKLAGRWQARAGDRVRVVAEPDRPVDPGQGGDVTVYPLDQLARLAASPISGIILRFWRPVASALLYKDRVHYGFTRQSPASHIERRP